MSKFYMVIAMMCLMVSFCVLGKNSRIREGKSCRAYDSMEGVKIEIFYSVDFSEKCSSYFPMFDLDCREDLSNIELPDRVECLSANSKFLLEDEIMYTEAGRRIKVYRMYGNNLNRECAGFQSNRNYLICKRFDLSSFPTQGGNPRIRDVE